MLKKLHPIIAYFKFLTLSVNQHGVHSPFVYKMITECFYNKNKHRNHQILKSYRNKLLQTKQILRVTDYGAGSKIFKTPERKVCSIASNAGISLKRGFLLTKLTAYLKCKTALELGTSLGLATVAIATASKTIRVTSIEGCPETASFARQKLKQYNIYNCKIVNKTFEAALKENLEPDYDLIYIDGNHRKEPTLLYFNQLVKHVHNNSVMVLDDIHWSSGMESAWNEIIAHTKVTVSIDTYKWGILFFRKEQAKQHFTIRV